MKLRRSAACMRTVVIVKAATAITHPTANATSMPSGFSN
jgi:hypothetical protein